MNCAFDKEKLTAFYDAELDAAGKTEVERHISSCSECLRDLGEIKSASLLVKELPRPRAPRSIAEGVSREIAATGRVHSFSRARSIALWVTAAAAGLFIVANVMFLAGGPANEAPVASKAAPSPALSAIPAAGEEKKGLDERQNSLALKEGKSAGYKSEPAEKAAAPPEKKEADRAFGQKDAPKPELARDRKELLAGRTGADGAKAKMDEKAPSEPSKAPSAAKPGAPAAPPPPAPKAEAPQPETAKQRLAEESEKLQNQFAGKGKRVESTNQESLELQVASAQMAKVRPQVEEIVRRYAARNRADAGARPQQQLHGEDLKKSVEARRESAGPLTLDLTLAEYEALKKEIEKTTGAQLVMVTPAEAGARTRGSAPAAGKAGPGEPERAVQGGAAGGGLAKAPAAPNADEFRRKVSEENLAKKEQQAPAGQQAPANAPKVDPLANKDKNAEENESRHLRQGETRIRITINFLEVPVVEKK